MSALPLCKACDLAPNQNPTPWLIEELWAEQAVGILGGEPKCCKSFLALDMAVSVAASKPCLRRYPVRRSGPVLVFPAEDAHPTVRTRLQGICAAAQTPLESLPLYIITSPRLLLDLPQDREQLRSAIAAVKPVLLVLDPFIRLHRADENASREIAPLLGYLRELQREFSLAVLLVHHVRKRAGNERPGQALRGSSDLHGWGDSNLYLRRHKNRLQLTIEHRAAPETPDVHLHLLDRQPALALAIMEDQPPETPPAQHTIEERILEHLRQADHPISHAHLRQHCRVRAATLTRALTQLQKLRRIKRTAKGYTLAEPFPVPPTPLGRTGNGNGKRRIQTAKPSAQLDLFPGETQAGAAGTQPAQG